MVFKNYSKIASILMQMGNLPVTAEMVIDHIEGNLEFDWMAGHTPEDKKKFVQKYMSKFIDHPLFAKKYGVLNGLTIDEIQQSSKLDDLFHECIGDIAMYILQFKNTEFGTVMK